MHYLTIATLVAAASAAVVPSVKNVFFDLKDQTSNGLVARGPEERNQCGDSLFIDKTSDGSPVQSDCAAAIFLLRYGQLPGGEPIPEYLDFVLPLWTEPYVVVAQYGTCALGARNAYEGSIRTTTNIGRDDVADLIQSSIERYGRNNRVGAEGAMVCRLNNAGVAWAVYRG